ncbi:aminoglycoside phosphotransferase family protein [bacterium]|nr:aminoglycoside phosphotransferase family protein [bacterium]
MNSMDKQFLAEGRVSDVYVLKDKRVLKLLHKTVPVEKVEDEYRRCKIVSAAGVLSPHALDLVEVDGRHGIIFEWAGENDLMTAKLGNPLNVRWGGRFMATVHLELLKHEAEKLPDIREEALRMAHTLPEGIIRSHQYPILERYLDQLPDGNNICHMDFHPGNIILSSNGYQIIDWAEAVKGAPEADLAMTSLILSMAETAPGTSLFLRIIIPIFRKAFERNYRAHLMATQPGITEENIEKWMLAAAIFRMSMWSLASEQAFLTTMIQQKLQEF